MYLIVVSACAIGGIFSQNYSALFIAAALPWDFFWTPHTNSDSEFKLYLYGCIFLNIVVFAIIKFKFWNGGDVE